MHDVRRETDNELCGWVEHDGRRWRSLTIFGGELGVHTDRDEAVSQVLLEGLSSLSDRWTLIDPATGEAEPVLIQETNTRQVVLVRGHYSLPGVPTTTVSTDDLRSGKLLLCR